MVIDPGLLVESRIETRNLPRVFKAEIPPKIFEQRVLPIDTDINVLRKNMPSATDVVKNQEPCPLTDSDTTSIHFTSTGGVMAIEEYGVTVNVPSGAIEDHHIVEIQAAASLFGPFNIPSDYHPVSAYVWIGSNYTFRKQIEIEFEHHADISNSASRLCILKACYTNCNSDHPVMQETTEDYDIRDSFCILYTNHFCSYCFAAKGIKVPDRIVAYHYLPEDYESVDKFRAEVCFCYDLNCCKKVMAISLTSKNYCAFHCCYSIKVAIIIGVDCTTTYLMYNRK